VGGLGPAVEVIGAEVAIEFTADQHVVDDGEDGGGERTDRLFGSATGAQPVKLRPGIALFAGCSPGALEEGGFESRRSFAHPGGAVAQDTPHRFPVDAGRLLARCRHCVDALHLQGQSDPDDPAQQALAIAAMFVAEEHADELRRMISS
jgi:hypothetical protein